MKFTSEDLMKAMGLQIGDRVKYLGEIYTVRENDDLIHSIYLYRYKDGSHIHLDLFEIFDKNYEILPRPKRVGDLMCEDFKDCTTCPLRFLCAWGLNIEPTITLLENLKSIEDFEKDDQEIYDLLKARLDKEVSE